MFINRISEEFYIHTSITLATLLWWHMKRGKLSKIWKSVSILDNQKKGYFQTWVFPVLEAELEKFFTSISGLQVGQFGWSRSERVILLQRGWCRGSCGWCYGHSGVRGRSKMWRCRSRDKQGTAEFQPTWSHPEEGHGLRHCAGNTTEKSKVATMHT